MKFLTKGLKEKYMVDFNEKVLNSTHEYWGLDNGLRVILIDINKNQKIQTLYSKRGTQTECISYLFIAIDRNYLNKINKIGNVLTNMSEVYEFCVNEPTQFLNNADENMACNNDKDYFNISVFCFYCISNNEENHNTFWDYLYENLVV